jgi:hypothetical protein
MLIKVFPVCLNMSGSLSDAAKDVDPVQGHCYIKDMITFAHTLRLRLPVVPTAGSFVVFAK